MQIEHDAIARALRAASLGPARARLVQTGIGQAAILRTLHAQVRTHRPRLAILAGVCGALAPVDDVPAIARVIDEHGHTWTTGVGFNPAGVTLVAVDRIAATPADKAALATSARAAIVDMESHAFAAACETLALPWSIVRGVSDTPTQTLPHEVLDWVAPNGRTRSARAAWDLLRKPTLIPHIIAVLRRSSRVMPKVAARVLALVNEAHR